MVGRVLKILALIFIALCVYVLVTLPRVPDAVAYGVSFSTLNAEELGLDWKKVYVAVLDDLQVRALRIPAYWSRVEKERDTYDWRELDFQIREAQRREAHIVLALGRRLPRWPECHEPSWAKDIGWEEKKAELRAYLVAVVERYKDSSAIEYWQVENEPYLALFAHEHCGDLDEDFLKEEIALVRSLDSRPILLTDSGNLGMWLSPYRLGDAFGTSMYLYFWNPEVGQFKTRLPSDFYRIKARLMEIMHGKKPAFLIELSLEPWLIEPIANTPVDVQLSRMNIEKFDEIVKYARATNFERQYLWGAEWWYYMKERKHHEFWQAARDIFRP